MDSIIKNYGRIIKNAPVGSLLIDINGRVLDINDSFNELFELSRRDLIAETGVFGYPPFIDAGIGEALKKCADTGNAAVTEHFFKRKQDKGVYIRLNAIPIKSDQGRVIGIWSIAEDITGTSQVKDIIDRLNEDRKRVQQYLDTINVILLSLDREGRITLINRKGCQVLGYTEEYILGKNWFDDFLPERLRDRSRAAYHLYMLGEVPLPEEFTSSMLAAGNVERIIYWHNSILYDEEGRISGSLHSGNDITEKRAMQRELDLRAVLLDQAMDSIYMLDEQGNIIYMNEATWKTRGYTKEEMLGMNIAEIVDGRYKDRIKRLIKDVITCGELTFETVHNCKDGTVFPVEIYSKVIKIGDKDCLINIARDISERKKADQVISHSEERFRTILEEMDNGYFELDMHGCYKFVNDAMCKILGLDRSEIISRHFSSFIDRDDEKFIESIKNTIDEVVNKGSAVAGLFGNILKGDGTRRIIGVSTSPMKDAVGKVIGVRGITRDITDRMKMEQQLLIASKLASIGELAAGVAHEINNPLTAIMGFAQLLMEQEGLPLQMKQDLDKIYAQSQRAAKIVQNLLTFSRSYSLEKKIIDINELILRTLDMRSYEHKVNNIEIFTELASGPIWISADENQVQQVILNILVNAEHAIISRRRMGIIRINTEVIDQKVKISIVDNGPGIPDSIKDRIFDPFFTTKDVGVGTGLGLSVCHGIVTKHGGTITAESVEGFGSTFIIELPVASTEEIGIASSISADKRLPELIGERRKILVVDDEVIIRDILERVLTERDFIVDVAESGEDGLKKLEEREYDIYLLDIKMPGVDGKDLYENIKNKYPHLVNRIIFITGDTVTMSTQDFLESTGRIYVSKPFDFASLIGSIEAVIREG